MNFFQGFSQGLSAYGQSMRLLLSAPFRFFLLFPVVAIVVVFVVGNYFVISLGSGMSEAVQLQVTEWLSGLSWLSWLSDTAGFVVRLIVRLLYYILFISFGGYAVMIVMSPVYSWLSERAEAHLSGKEYPFSFRRLAWEIGRGIIISLRCMFLQFVAMLVILFLAFIPPVGLITPLLTFLVGAYFYGFAFMDYAVERKQFRVRDSVRYMRRNAGLAVGVGTIFSLALMIPFLRIVACSFVSLLSVIAGTIVVSDNLNKKSMK